MRVKSLLLSGIASLFLAQTALAQTLETPPAATAPQVSSQDRYYSQWMTYYYQQKDISQMPGFLKWLQTSQIVELKKTAGDPLCVFLSFLFAVHPDQVPAWLKATEFTGRTRLTVEAALWMAGNTEQLALFAPDSGRAQAHKPPVLADTTPQTGGQLDGMWAAFSATGDTLYVKKVIGALSGTRPEVAAAAQWSLGSNMKQHPLVAQTVKAEDAVQTGEVKQKLDQLLTQPTN